MTHAYFSSVSAHSECSLSWLHADAKSTLFSFSSFCLSLSHSPLQCPVLHHYSAFQNMERKAENRDTYFRLTKKHLQKQLSPFPTEVSACLWHPKTHTQLLSSIGGKSLQSQSPWKMRYRSIGVQYAQIQWVKPLRVSVFSYSEDIPTFRKSLTNFTTVLYGWFLLVGQLKQVC